MTSEVYLDNNNNNNNNNSINNDFNEFLEK